MYAYEYSMFQYYNFVSAALIDKQAISKLERDDLEDKFIVYADENMSIKKQLRNQERHIQRQICMFLLVITVLKTKS